MSRGRDQVALRPDREESSIESWPTPLSNDRATTTPRRNRIHVGAERPGSAARGAGSRQPWVRRESTNYRLSRSHRSIAAR
jgi:hypothetical protein